MEKLYYEDPYIKEFTAEIVNVIEKNSEYHVELDKTCFYPEGGGQPSDTGYINSSPIKHVYEENSVVYHVMDIKPIKIHRVKCSIDWDRRFDYMQQHLGQHILSACILKEVNSNTVGFHLSSEYSTIDIDKVIGSEEIKKLEAEANRIVFDSLNVEAIYPTSSELKKLKLSKLPTKSGDKLRIIKIGDFDLNPCGGTHPKSTIEVQIVKITKWEKYKNGTRIEFLCGSRAVKDYLLKHSYVEGLSKKLSCSMENLLPEIERVYGELNKSLSEARALKAEVADYEVKDMLSSIEEKGGIRIVKSIYENSDLKHINLLASKLTSYPNVIVLFGVVSKDKVQMIFMCSKDLRLISMNKLLKDAITLIDGSGGGSDFSAQGGGKNNNNLSSALDYAYNRIMEHIKG